MPFLVLAVNPGSTSTKLALFRDETIVREANLKHADADLAPFPRVFDQLDLRVAAVDRLLAEAGVKAGELSAVVGRGGLLKPLPSGTYAVDEAMLADLEEAKRGEHASNLGGAIARKIAERHGCPAFIVDPVSVDEMEPVARVSGLDGVERHSRVHALNMKAVAKRHAKTVGKEYPELRLVVAHLGSGVSLSVHSGGRMIDTINPQDEGPFSPDRAGGIPATDLIDLCFREGATPKSVRRILFGDGGLYSYLGTRDAREMVKRAEAGEEKARLVLEAMSYQVAKCIGELATVLRGQLDGILLTGGMAYNAPVVEGIRGRVEWIAPVFVYPGEDELQALCEGALRVLRGEEPARRYADA
jgi:butyrate kinase